MRQPPLQRASTLALGCAQIVEEPETPPKCEQLVLPRTYSSSSLTSQQASVECIAPSSPAAEAAPSSAAQDITEMMSLLADRKAAKSKTAAGVTEESTAKHSKPAVEKKKKKKKKTKKRSKPVFPKGTPLKATAATRADSPPATPSAEKAVACTLEKTVVAAKVEAAKPKGRPKGAASAKAKVAGKVASKGKCVGKSKVVSPLVYGCSKCRWSKRGCGQCKLPSYSGFRWNSDVES